MVKRVQWLSDEEWARIEPLPPRGRKGGIPGGRSLGRFREIGEAVCHLGVGSIDLVHAIWPATGGR